MSHATETVRILRSMGKLCTEHDPDVFRSILDRVGDKWSLLLIGVLEPGPKRYTELLEIVPGISRRMLAVTLRALERDGLVTRTAYDETPPRVEYAATELGTTLHTPVLMLAAWVADNQDVIERHRTHFDDEREQQATASASS